MLRILFSLFLLNSIVVSNYAQDSTKLIVDFDSPTHSFPPAWAWFGYDEPNYTYMPNGKKLLSELAALSPTPVYVRTHNLLTTGDGKPELKWGSTNAYTEDKKGRPVYNWTIIDSIVDTYVKRGMKPLMEIGFMPEALSTHPVPYKHTWASDGKIWTGWTYPPKDYKKWSALVYEWVNHSIARYGADEVKNWYWELWNEPNIGYWSGTFDEYCKLYDFTADAVKRACPECTIGGPHTTNPDSEKAEKFLRDFLTHCAEGKNYVTGRTGAPLDYISFHAKGNPELVEGKVRMNMSPQLKAVSTGFKVVASFEKFKNLPVVIGESDPEGCAACSLEKHPQYAYRNGTMYSSYTAASISRIYELAQQHKINLAGIVTWAFEFEDQKWFDGFRELATNGVDKPVLNVFRMLGLMPALQLPIRNDRGFSADDIIKNGVRERADVHAIATRNTNKVAVMVWNYLDDDVFMRPQIVELITRNIPGRKVIVQHYRIDQETSNAYEYWKKIGSPQRIDDDQYKALERSGKLQLLTSPEWITPKNGEVMTTFQLPSQGVSLIVMEWE